MRALTTQAGDKRSLAVGMAGHLTTLTFNSQHREAAAMATEFATLVDSIGDPAMTAGLFYAAAQAKWEVGEATECLQLAQRIIDVAHGDPTMGNFVIGSPLAWAITLKGAAGMFLGRPGWRQDLEEGIAMARSFDPTTHPFAQLYKYAAAVQNGAVLPTAEDVKQTSESLNIARRSGDNAALAYALVNRATALIRSDGQSAGEGFEYLAKAREMLVDEKLIVAIRRMTDAEIARGRARAGDLDGAIDLVSRILNAQFEAGTMMFRAPATTALVETLLARGGPGDVDAAQHAIDRLADVPVEPGFVLHEIPVLRLRALLARVRGDESGYRQLLQRFRARAQDVGFEGYVAQADAMAAD